MLPLLHFRSSGLRPLLPVRVLVAPTFHYFGLVLNACGSRFWKMSAPRGTTDFVSGAGAFVMGDDVAHQVGGVTAVAATGRVDAIVAGMLVIDFTAAASVKVGYVGFAAPCIAT